MRPFNRETVCVEGHAFLCQFDGILRVAAFEGNDALPMCSRKNWQFAGPLMAGERAAAIMSLIQSAKLNGHDPYAYIRDVLTRLPTHAARDIDLLLPHRWEPLTRRCRTSAESSMCWLAAYIPLVVFAFRSSGTSSTT